MIKTKKVQEASFWVRFLAPETDMIFGEGVGASPAVHRSVPTNLQWLPNCSHAHALFQDRFKDVQVGSRWFSTLYFSHQTFT